MADPEHPILAEAHAWYDQVYQPWVTGAIGGVSAPGGAASLTGPAASGSGEPVTVKDAASVGCLSVIDPTNWMAPWDFIEHVDHLLDNPIGIGCGCFLIILLLPCLLPWALIALVLVAFGLRPMQRNASALPVATGPIAMAGPDPLPDWLLAQGIIRNRDPLPPWWSAVTQHAAQQGVQPNSWQPRLAYRMAASEESRDWVQVQVRRDDEGGRAQLWTIAVWPAAVGQPLIDPAKLASLGIPIHRLPDGVVYAILTHPIVTMGFSAAPVSWVELELWLNSNNYFAS